MLLMSNLIQLTTFIALGALSSIARNGGAK